MKFVTILLIGLSVMAWALQVPASNVTPYFPKSPYKNWGLIAIQAECAWKLAKKHNHVKVAVIDTGVDQSHPDLKDRVSGSSPGWDFVKNSAAVGDSNGHGTHVAGIIGANDDPKSGVRGVASYVSIVPVNYYADANPGNVNLKNTVQAIHYAIDSGVRIINYSGGGPEFSEAEFEALKRANKEHVLVVAAAGNDHQSVDDPKNYYYPAAYKLSNIVVVSASTIMQNLTRSSSWGSKRVDVVAPGENIFSTLPNNRFGYMSGTSQATAFVTGLAALLLSENPSLTPEQVKAAIVNTVDRHDYQVASRGQINACKAMKSIQMVTK